MKKIKFIMAVVLVVIAGCSSKKIREDATPDEILKEDRISYHRVLSYPRPKLAIARPVPYLDSTRSSRDRKDFFYGESEGKILSFYKDLNHRGYGDLSSYWRWSFSIGERELQNTLNAHLPEIAKKRPKEVFTYRGGRWENRPVGANPIGTLEDIKVLERGKSGIITQFLIVGSKGSYLVTKEGNIRGLIKLRKESIGTRREIILKGSKGEDKTYGRTLMRNPSSLPSAFFAVEKKQGQYHFYGGGYGHGVGMPQWSAYDLGKNHGFSYKNILKRYYSDVSFKNMYSIGGVGKTIRIGISTTGFKGLDHERGVFSSRGKMTAVIGGKSYTVKAREKVEVINRNGNLVLKINGKEIRSTKGAVQLKPSKEPIGIENIRRITKKTPYPVYRGTMEIRIGAVPRKIRIINEVGIEDYLLQVVPSEMGESFGLEALKAQAVAARTYALKDYLGNKYKAQGFHIDDSTKSQVYNNQDENELSTKAVKATKGEVMLYNNRPIDAKYYSTTPGFGAAAHNVW